ncbi:spore coat protein U domain-containing protein [Altererythrobacter sp. CC-YST694]|uniref:Csu type fimbrial protein n=1 Tax=Altererythrobacter sp. CC-YST694 TaxID=2755038 RepID=UPI001D0025A0|nr:spore coat protein U domain-containing protein [Altererythrobacter sp. CC-YST694]MCB5425946.1 spore coat protein U domain-containing protein [Altererythrobacter sp. CC-YST694]
MSLAEFLTGQPRIRAAAMVSATLLLLALLFWPQSARANVVCSLASQPVTLSFGNALTANGEIRYTCRSYNTQSTSFTICASRGTASYPGTTQQPLLQSGSNELAFNVYVDSAATSAWTSTNLIARSVTVAAGATITGSLPFYGKIAAGQQSPIGNYQAFFFNSVLGFLTPDGRNCLPNIADLNGLDFTLFVTATVPQACNLGTIAAMDFGTPAGLWTRADAAAAVQVFCPQNVSWQLAFGAGLHAAAGERRMQSEQGDYVTYRLYRDSARAQPIGIDETIAGTGSGAVQSVPMYGRVEVLQPPAVGNYSDTVIVVLSF